MAKPRKIQLEPVNYFAAPVAKERLESFTLVDLQKSRVVQPNGTPVQPITAIARDSFTGMGAKQGTANFAARIAERQNQVGVPRSIQIAATLLAIASALTLLQGILLADGPAIVLFLISAASAAWLYLQPSSISRLVATVAGMLAMGFGIGLLLWIAELYFLWVDKSTRDYMEWYKAEQIS